MAAWPLTQINNFFSNERNMDTIVWKKYYVLTQKIIEQAKPDLKFILKRQDTTPIVSERYQNENTAANQNFRVKYERWEEMTRYI